MEVISGVSLSSSEHIEHVFAFCLLLITIPIHLSFYEVLLLPEGGVHTIVKLVRVIDLVGQTRLTVSGTVPAEAIVTSFGPIRAWGAVFTR